MTSRFGPTAVFGFVCLLSGLAVVAPRPVAAQDMQQLLNKLTRLEREMQDMQRQVYGGAAPTASPAPVITSQSSATLPTDAAFAARVEVRLQQLETMIRSLTGKIEEVEFQVGQTADRLEKMQRDVDFRFQAVEGRGAGEPQSAIAQQQPTPSTAAQVPASAPAAAPANRPGTGQGVFGHLKESEIAALDKAGAAALAPREQQGAAPAAKPKAETKTAAAPSGKAALPEGPAADQYKYAFDFLTKQDFDNAERALSAFVERHPKDPLAANAIYWLGETYYVRKDYANAAKTFAAGYQNYPGSSKTADNLLKLAFSLARLDRKSDACLTLARLDEEFPNAAANIKRRAVAEKERLGCK